MKIYTKTGDKGKTSLFGGTRVPKHHIRINAYGTVDELNSYIGLLRDQKIDNQTTNSLIKIQNELFTIGSMLATSPEKKILKNGKELLNIPKINSRSIEYLENQIDEINENLPPLTNFVLPGGHTTVSFCHISRCICRRAERIVTELSTLSEVDTKIIVYLNRLSDYLFVLARKLAKENNAKEINWIPEKF